MNPRPGSVYKRIGADRVILVLHSCGHTVTIYELLLDGSYLSRDGGPIFKFLEPVFFAFYEEVS